MKLQRQKQNHLQELLGAGIFGHSLGALGHCMLGQLSRQQEANSSLDLTRGDGGPVERRKFNATGENTKRIPLVVVGKLASLGSNPLEEVVDKGVHDGHSLG